MKADVIGGVIPKNSSGESDALLLADSTLRTSLNFNPHFLDEPSTNLKANSCHGLMVQPLTARALSLPVSA
jgi:hypothetical protein